MTRRTSRRTGRAVIAPAIAGALLAACGPAPRTFDEEAAWRHLVSQVELGPRVPGTQAHRDGLEYVRSHLEGAADTVWVDSFEATCAVDSSRASMHNVVALFRPDLRHRILFGAHWDSRPVADRDPDPARRSEPVPGANDGASGVAVLLEVASALASVPPEVGVDLVLFDAEDCGVEEDPDTWALGSQRFVEQNPGYRPAYVVVLDMVGRAGMRLVKEANSAAAAPLLVTTIWHQAAEMGETAFVDSVGRAVWDDHIPFLRAGIPAVDIIDFEDPAWHTTDDTPDHCAPASLGQVGRLVLALVRRAEDARAR